MEGLGQMHERVKYLGNSDCISAAASESYITATAAFGFDPRVRLSFSVKIYLLNVRIHLGNSQDIGV